MGDIGLSDYDIVLRRLAEFIYLVVNRKLFVVIIILLCKHSLVRISSLLPNVQNCI